MWFDFHVTRFLSINVFWYAIYFTKHTWLFVSPHTKKVCEWSTRTLNRLVKKMDSWILYIKWIISVLLTGLQKNYQVCFKLSSPQLGVFHANMWRDHQVNQDHQVVKALWEIQVTPVQVVLQVIQEPRACKVLQGPKVWHDVPFKKVLCAQLWHKSSSLSLYWKQGNKYQFPMSMS